MLADEEDDASAGSLARDLFLPATFVDALFGFVVQQAPLWREDPRRRKAVSEKKLSSQLTLHLSAAARRSPLDHVTFHSEVPDELVGSRVLDLGAFPSGRTIWMSGRSYDIYAMLLPIECKRLPAPTGKGREKREYVETGTTDAGTRGRKAGGGIQRFKAALHGGAHDRGAIIGFVQARSAPWWHRKLDRWIAALAKVRPSRWTVAERPVAPHHDPVARTVTFSTCHPRRGRAPMTLSHLLIEM